MVPPAPLAELPASQISGFLLYGMGQEEYWKWGLNLRRAISKVAQGLEGLRKHLGWHEWEAQVTYLGSPAFGQVL